MIAESAPVKALAPSGTGAVRFGVVGSLSTTSSARASKDMMTAAAVDPNNARREPVRSSHPQCTAQLTTARGVRERRPAMTPMPKPPRNRTAQFEFIVYFTSRVFHLAGISPRGYFTPRVFHPARHSSPLG